MRMLALSLSLSLLAVPAAASTRVFATATDFGGPGCASWVALDPPRTPHSCREPLSSDAVVRFEHGLYYVVNRFGADNVQIVGPGVGDDLVTVRQFSVGNGSNPQDIAVVAANKAYVSFLNTDYVLIVDPETGTPLDSIPLGPFADADGIPEATKMEVANGRLFVALQRLEAFAPTDHSSVVVIDLATDTIVDADPLTGGVQAIRLAGRNPVSDFAVDPANGRLLIASAGAYGVEDDGGVEAIDPVSLDALGFEATEATLGAEVSDIAVGAGGERFAALAAFDFGASSIARYARGTGTVTQTLFATGGFSLGDIEVNDRDELWVCDRTFTAPGLRAYAVASGASIAGPIDVGLPPFDLVFDTPAIVAAPTPPAAPGVRLLGAGPNPADGPVTIRFAIDAPARIGLIVIDARGRTVAEVEREATAGTNAWTWTPTPGARGVYFFRLEHGRQSVTGRIVVLGGEAH